MIGQTSKNIHENNVFTISKVWGCKLIYLSAVYKQRNKKIVELMYHFWILKKMDSIFSHFLHLFADFLLRCSHKNFTLGKANESTLNVWNWTHVILRERRRDRPVAAFPFIGYADRFRSLLLHSFRFIEKRQFVELLNICKRRRQNLEHPQHYIPPKILFTNFTYFFFMKHSDQSEVAIPMNSIIYSKYFTS